MIERFNDKQKKILLALGKYKFLTYSQMIRLGIANQSSNLSTDIKELSTRRTPFVRKIPHGFGRRAKFYLTAKGKELLASSYDIDSEKIKYPRGIISEDTQDEKHRTTIIDCEIELNLSASSKGIPILFSDRYFDKVGNNRIDKNLKSKTAILYTENKSVKADLVFKIKTPKQEELYILELENGKDTKKAVEKCINHGKAILLGSANKKYGFKQGYRTLWIFEYENTMKATMDRLYTQPFFAHMKEYFLFKPLSSIQSDFTQKWKNIEGKERTMYYT